MGFEEAAPIGSNATKTPRGIMNYGLSGHASTDVTWKITGNLGGERYVDKIRGPLNEGGLYAERNGYHLPNPPSGLGKTVSHSMAILRPELFLYDKLRLEYPGWL